MYNKRVSKKNAFNTVTPLSKTLAFALFVILPFVGFYLGMQYQKGLDKPFLQGNEAPKATDPIERACTMEAKLCADGSAVGRSGPNCEFEKCPEELSD